MLELLKCLVALNKSMLKPNLILLINNNVLVKKLYPCMFVLQETTQKHALGWAVVLRGETRDATVSKANSRGTI